MSGDKGSSFFRRPIKISGQSQPVPMQLFGAIRVVVDVDNHLAALLES